jgi:hypothetical protein
MLPHVTLDSRHVAHRLHVRARVDESEAIVARFRRRQRLIRTA